MIFGTITFRCSECGEQFEAPNVEFMAMCFAAPMPCPKCGSMHTLPSGASTEIYKPIWERCDRHNKKCGKKTSDREQDCRKSNTFADGESL